MRRTYWKLHQQRKSLKLACGVGINPVSMADVDYHSMTKINMLGYVCSWDIAADN